MIQKIKKQLPNIIMIAVVLTLLISIDAKALVQRGIMKLGIFQPKFEKLETIENKSYELQVKDADSNIIHLNDLKGKVVFINFWATWCPPCIAEMPSINALHQKFANDSEVEIIALEMDGNVEKANKFMNRKGYDIPTYFPNSAIPYEFYDGTLPTTIILDKRGQLIYKIVGIADYSGEDILDILNELKAEN